MFYWQYIRVFKSFIGRPFFGSHIQEVAGHNKILNNFVQKVMSGNAASEIYEFKNGQIKEE